MTADRATTRRHGPARHGKRAGLFTLEQRFWIEGARADRVATILWNEPLIGARSILGDRPGARSREEGGRRIVEGFSPVPGFRFDVILERRERLVYVVRFGQPEREVPYLKGECAWLLSDGEHGALFDEQINTDRAMEHIREPLTGPRPSLRRWLFFRVGHLLVMDQALRNIAALCSSMR